MLHVVRHATPAADPDVPPHRWVLGADGRTAARDLARRLPAGALLVASTEPKAYQTLDVTGVDVVRDPRLGEVRRPPEPWNDGWRTPRRLWVEGEDRPGWESRAEVAARFDVAVRDALAAAVAAGMTDVVVATHGMSLTCWLVARGVVPASAAGDFWQRLAFPDHLLVDLGVGRWWRPDDAPDPRHRRARLRGRSGHPDDGQVARLPARPSPDC